MKPDVVPRKPLQGRNRTNGQPVDPNRPVVPRLLRRTTKQSFMDVDLQYLMKLDPSTPDPFADSSPVFCDPPSLFRPVPATAAAAHALAAQNGSTVPWTFHDAARLQKEQEDLRVQYLQFLHQLHMSNPHGFLAHMNTFATEHPIEFIQLQAYIRFKEQESAQQQAEADRIEQMRQYQIQLEERRKQEEELRQFHKFQQLQEQQNHAQELRQLLQEWLMRRQQLRSCGFGSTKELDLADVFAVALQKDPQLVERMSSTPGGLDLLMTPQQQIEFGQFVQQRKQQEWFLQEEMRNKMQRDLVSAGFSNLATPSSSSLSMPSGFVNPFSLTAQAGLGSTNPLINFSRYDPPVNNNIFGTKTTSRSRRHH
ncbi:hypothetical protein BGW38_004477 [Lunasporangiospora selenospora]|uniref:Uncharacterized protein n=1 Tax=Lunasporangiospora selenospora TaxID=979761 RepID=A0A9P6FQG6_9FUNG|nr:hypothetical protein BGW38_004477 [Lunasporangiospora selenospora]